MLKWIKKTFVLLLIVIQITALDPAYKVLSIVTKENCKWKINFLEGEEDLKARIIQDQDFIKNWSIIAHMLGFAWCGGTGSLNVGEDFVFEKFYENDNNNIAHEVYYLKANFNSDDVYHENQRADERLQMRISDVRLIIEPTTLKFGIPKTIYTKSSTIASVVLENTSDEDNDTIISFNYTSSKSWSKSDNCKLNGKIDVKTKFIIGIPLIDSNETKVNIEFDTDQGWEQSEGVTVTEINSVQYYDKVHANSKRNIELVGSEKQLQIPYEAKIYIEYIITLTGFLSNSEKGNAHVDHPTDRPTKSITFGGKNHMSATEDLLDMYNNRNTKGYSEWDWNWAVDNFGKANTDYHINEICKVKRGRKITGVFNEFEGTHIGIKTFDSEPINISIRDDGVPKENKVELKDFKSYKTHVFNVKNLSIDK